MGDRGPKPHIRADVVRLLPTLNNSQIARTVGCSREWVRQVRDVEGVPNPMPGAACSRIMTEDMLTLVMKRFREGKCLTEIARELKIVQYSLWQFLRARGIQSSNRWSTMRKANLTEIAEMWLNGCTLKGTAEKMGLSPITIARAWKKLGLVGIKRSNRRVGKWKTTG